MVKRFANYSIWVLGASLFCANAALAQEGGSIRGMVHDKDFDSPLSAPQVTIVETGQVITGNAEGNYVSPQLAPGTYTLVFTKDGYTRQVKSNITVTPNQLTEVDVWMSGEFTEMEEFVVQDIQISLGTEAGLLALRAEAPGLMDSISADLMSRAGAGDAASALRLVAGTSVQDGKYAVVRGLPDRYVSSQMNGVRLPTADIDKRAVELDQFPSAVIESIQVSKTFTPDQQGDASGGAVNVVLKGIPDENIIQFSSQVSYNTQTTGRSDFLTYKGGGVDFWGLDDGGRDIQSEFLAPNGGDGMYRGAAGVSRGEAPIDYKWALTAGGKYDIDDDVKIGALANFFYERNSSFYDNGKNDSLFFYPDADPFPGRGLEHGMNPYYSQGNADAGGADDPNVVTSLLDVTKSTQDVKWGGLLTSGIETKYNRVGLVYLYTRAAQDVTVLTEDKRGKYFFYPDYDIHDPFSPGYFAGAPFTRQEVLTYTERGTQTAQLHGEHTIPIFPQDESSPDDTGLFALLSPQLDWTAALSSATMDQPDKRQFGEKWTPPINLPDFDYYQPGQHVAYLPAASSGFGNIQRIWKAIDEDSTQYFIDFKWPFKQWTHTEGYIKTGVFSDDVDRVYKQSSFSNTNISTVPGDEPTFYNDPTEDYAYSYFWSSVIPDEYHPLYQSRYDLNYQGAQKIFAWYWMADLPITDYLKFIGGVRFENTNVSTVVTPHDPAQALIILPGSSDFIQYSPALVNQEFKQSDVLPALAVEIKPLEKVVVRGSYAETVARQTFKELTPILQSEYLGGPSFIGNKNLTMSALKNYDLRVDYTPHQGSLFSASYFYKDIQDPIEYVQYQFSAITYSSPVNYTSGTMSGFELEARDNLGEYLEDLTGLSVGVNFTYIDSQVMIDQARIDKLNVLVPDVARRRDMLNAPNYLYNIYATYDVESTGTQISLFYTVRGDTLVAGAGNGPNGGIVPDLYDAAYGTLNFGITQQIGKYIKLKFQAKNLMDPEIKQVYRGNYIGADVTKSSYTKGIDLSLGLSAEFKF